VRQKRRRRHPQRRPPGGILDPLGSDQPRLQQQIDRRLAERSTVDLFDLGPGQRLILCDDRQHLPRRARQPPWCPHHRLELRRTVERSAELPAAANLDQLDNRIRRPPGL